MFVDASAIVAILKGEPDADELIARLDDHDGDILVSPLVLLEAVAGIARTPAGVRRPTPDQFAEAEVTVRAFLARLGARMVAITTEVGDAAIGAGRTYGKFVGHPADLNFGDCYAYACATVHRVPLLYKGNDFAQTDLA